MKIPSINSYITKQQGNTNNISLHSSSDKYEQAQKIRELCDKKTEILDELGLLLLISGFCFDGQKVSFSKNIKNTTKQKIGFGLLCSSIVLIFGSLIWRIKLFQQYKKEGSIR